MPLRVFITAGEVSGDLHAANLARQLKILRPDVIIEGFGGPAMREAGVVIHHDTVDRAVMGLKAVLRSIEVLRLLGWLKSRYRRQPPDLHICVDSWSMNWLFARQAKLAGVKVLYYIAPQAWASRPGRVRQLHKYVDQLACILPFEEEWFCSRGVNAKFVGHPLFDHLPEKRAPRPPIPADGFVSRPPIIGLIPGSRRGVAKGNLPPLLDVAEIIQRKFPDAEFLIPTTPATHEIATEELKNRPRNYLAVKDGFDEIAPRCDLAITISGTSTLHLASYGVPMIVVYRGSRILWHLLGRWIINLRTYAMVNLLSDSGRHIVPEFIPWFGPPAPVADAALDLLTHPDKLAAQRQSLDSLIARLDKPGASRNVAELAVELMGQMRIPRDAIIIAGKLAKYLLVRRAKDDKSRYLAQAGFDQSNPEMLEAAIRRAIEQSEARFDRANKFGTYYTVRCELVGPSGRKLPVVLVWLYRLDGVYSFITLVPARER
jgi:lipid-A-disaccharide synthase